MPLTPEHPEHNHPEHDRPEHDRAGLDHHEPGEPDPDQAAPAARQHPGRRQHSQPSRQDPARPPSQPAPDTNPNKTPDTTEPGMAGPDATEEVLPLSVWPTGQRPAAAQRRGRYLPGSTAHPAKMLPALAATAITSFTQPGELVLDPMCGIGTTLVEAAHLGRDAVGIEVEPRWASVARANLDHARTHGAPGSAGVITGDARHAGSLITDPGIAGQVALLLTSPPYGHSVHGQVAPGRDTGRPKVRKWDNDYGKHPHNLVRGNHERLLAGFTDILTACLPLVRPGGIVAITTRPFRRHGSLVDFPGQVWAAAQDAGFEPVQRIVALLCGINRDRLVTRASFFSMHETRKARASGLPLQVTAHEDLLVLRRPPKAPSSAEPGGAQHEPADRFGSTTMARPQAYDASRESDS